MNLKEQNNDLLEEAIATITNEAPPSDLYARCLDKARVLDLPPVKTLNKKSGLRRKSWSAALVGMAALALLSVTLPSFFHSSLAIAQIESSLAAIKFLRVEIVNPQSEEVMARIGFSQVEGYRLDSNNRLEVDNGEYRLEVDKISKRGLKFPSKMKTGFKARQLLDDWTRLPEQTSGDSFKRRVDLDQILSEEKLECYVWSESIGLTQYESLAYRDHSKRIRMLSSRHRVGSDQSWIVDSLVRLSYDAIPKQEFDIEQASEFELVESAVKQIEVNGRSIDEDVLAVHQQVVAKWPEYFGLKFDLQVKASRSYGPEVDKSSRVKSRAFPGKPVEFRDEFSVLAPEREGQRPRRFWKRYQSQNGQEVLVSAVSFDGAATRSYSQKFDSEPGKGFIVGSEEITPQDDIPNYYEQLLFLQINFVNNATPIPPELATFDLDRMHITASHQRERWIESEFSFHGESTSGPIAYEIKIANHPLNRVVGYQINLNRNGKQQRLGLLDVHSHGEFEGTWYPASGMLQQAGFGLLDEFEYRFEVTSVSRLPEDAEDSWWIKWPEGTIVNDQVEKRNYTIDGNP